MGVKKLGLKRSSTGLLKHRSKKIGFLKTNQLTQEPKNILLKRVAKKLGIREKRRLLLKSKVKKPKQKKDDIEEDDEMFEGAQQLFLDNFKLSNEDELILKQFNLLDKDPLKNNLVQKIQENFQQGLNEEQEKSYRDNILNNPKVREAYGSIAEILSKYRSGKLPQPLHVLPKLEHWKGVLALTQPEQWTPQAMFACTKIFISAMDNISAEYFNKEILLKAVTLNIKTDKRLNVHLFKALIKALYKPQAWFKGILFPLCESPETTLKEAQIVGSVIHRQSIPQIHGSIAIYKLCQLPFTGPTAIILKILIEKKYALPEKVLESLIQYFVQFQDDERQLPVIWHQMILRLCENYKLSENHKVLLKRLINQKEHHIITKEIHKLLSKKNSGMDVE